MAGINFMAYAQGAEMANQANWKDIFNERALRSQDLQQQAGELGLQDAMTKSQDANDERDGSVRAAAYQTNVLKRLAEMEPAEQNNFLIGSLQQEFKNLGDTPRDNFYRKRLEDFAQFRGANALKAGDAQGGMGLLGLTSAGPDLAQRLAKAQRFGDPRNWTADTFASEGFVLQPDGSVRSPDGRSLTTGQAAGELHTRYSNPFGNFAATAQKSADELARSKAGDDDATALRNLTKQLGLPEGVVTQDPVTRAARIDPRSLALMQFAAFAKENGLSFNTAAAAASAEPAPAAPAAVDPLPTPAVTGRPLANLAPASAIPAAAPASAANAPKTTQSVMDLILSLAAGTTPQPAFPNSAFKNSAWSTTPAANRASAPATTAAAFAPVAVGPQGDWQSAMGQLYATPPTAGEAFDQMRRQNSWLTKR